MKRAEFNSFYRMCLLALVLLTVVVEASASHGATSDDAGLVSSRLTDNLKAAITEGKNAELAKDAIELLGQLDSLHLTTEDSRADDAYSLAIQSAEICDKNERRKDALEICLLTARVRSGQLHGIARYRESQYDFSKFLELRRTDQTLKRLKALELQVCSPPMPYGSSSLTALHPRKLVGQPAIFRFTLNQRLIGPSNSPHELKGSDNPPKMLLTVKCPSQNIVFKPDIDSDELMTISLGISTEVIVNGRVVRKLYSRGPAPVRFYKIKPQTVEVKGLFSDQVLTEEYKLETMNCVDSATLTGPIIWLH